MKKITILSIITLAVKLSFGQIDVQNYLIKGHHDLMQSEYTTAIQRFNTIIQIKPDMLEAYYFRGFAKYSLSDYIGAFADFNKVIELNPYFAEGYRFRGIAKSAMQDYQDAMEDFEKAIKLDLASADNYVSRGFTYLLIKDYDKAIADFNQAIIIDKNLPYAYLHRGHAKLSKKDFKGAVKDFSKAIQLRPYNPSGFGDRALAYSELEEYDKALDDLNFAIKTDKSNTLFYFNRALIKYKTKDYDGTMADYNKVIELDPQNALTYYNRAILKSEMGDKQGAINDYTHSSELNPNNILPYFNRGGIKYDIKDYYGAIQDWSQAIELFPDFVGAYKARSSARFNIGDYVGAKKDKDIADKKIKEYEKIHQKDSTMSDFMDTSYNFKKVIEFDSDFFRADIKDGQIQNKRIVIDLKPILIVTVKNESVPRENFAFYLPSLDKLNNKNTLNIPFTIASNLPDIPIDSVRQLLNSTEQQKIKLSADNYLYFYQGLLNSMIQNYNQAIKAYTMSIDIDPKSELAYFNRANTRYMMIDYLNSMNDFSQVVTIEGKATSQTKPKQQVSHNDAYNDVIKDLDKAIKLNPTFSFAYYNRGNVKCMQKNFTEAISDYTQAVKFLPDMAQAYFNRGLTLIYLQDKEKGCMDISKAGELGIKDAYPILKKYCK